MNIGGLVHAALRAGPCRGTSADLRVRIPASGLATSPDLTVVCGPFVAHPEDPDACTNPSALFEVLSASTEAYDRGEKFAHYRRLPTLREYVLVAQDRVRIEQFTRREDGGWLLREHGPGAVLRLEVLGIDLAVDEVYEGVALTPPQPRGQPSG
jgi:Uma2 family endonuclease